MGDLETYPLPNERFDLIFCRFVLEHLSDPERALANMRRALKPGGWLALVFPNRWSLKGLVTRLTPHSFHVLSYRLLFGPGSPTPFKTRFGRAVSNPGIRHFAERESLRVIMLEEHPGDLAWLLRKHSPILGGVWLVSERVVELLTLGRVSPRRREIIAILADPRPPEVAVLR